MDALLRRRAMIAEGGSPTPPPPPTPTIVYHDRIRFDGTAYIQTDLVVPTNGSVRVSAGGETRKGNQGIFNATDGTNVCFGIWMTTATDATKRVYAHRYGTTTTDSTRVTINNYTTRASLFLTPNRWGYSTNPYNATAGTNVPTNGIRLGSTSQSYAYTGALGWFYIYDSSAQNATDWADLRDNYTPVYTLRPCEYNGEVGYICDETGTFYGNSAGEGTLSYEDN